MKGWDIKKLASLACFKNGLNYSRLNFGLGLKVIGVSDFQDYNYPKYNALDEIDPKGIVREEDLLAEGDFLFVRSNGNRELIGRCLFIKGLKEKVSHSGFTIRARFKNLPIEKRFFLYFFKSNILKKTLSLYGGGTNINNLNQSILANLDVPFPPIAIQRKIAAVLSAYDDLIENNNRRIAILEKMAEELYREWFVRLRFPGHEKTKIIKGIPEGWEEKSALALFDVLGGGTPKTEISSFWDGEIPFFTPKDSHNGYFATSTEKSITIKGLQSCNSRLFSKHTIFITARGTVGNIVLAIKPMAMNQSCYALVPKTSKHIFFYFMALRNSVSLIKGTSNSGVFDNIVTESFKLVKLFKPSFSFLEQFEANCKPLFEQIENLLISGDLLLQSRDKLLSRLMSGRINLENLDIQFPTSMQEEE